jgi:hypothetical protein
MLVNAGELDRGLMGLPSYNLCEIVVNHYRHGCDDGVYGGLNEKV